MRFVGISLAWRPGEAGERDSCLVVIDERGSIVSNSFARTAAEIAGTVEAVAEGRRGVVVGVDAPLSVPNERGTRRVERVLSRMALPAYSASRKMFGDAPFAEELLAELEERDVEYTDYPMPRARGQRVVTEVDSGAALKVIQLERNGDGGKSSADGDPVVGLRELPEPKLRKGNKEARASALKGAVETLWDTPGLRLRTGNLSADLGAEENVDLSKLDVSSDLSHAQFDRISDLVEGTLAAYAVHRHWRGRDGSAVVGTSHEGSVLLPASDTLHARLAEECRNAGVPYV